MKPLHRIVAVCAMAALFTCGPTLLPTESTAMPKSPTAVGGKTLTGTVIETMNASGYTYLLVASGGVQTWVAIPETVVTQGSQVSYHDGMEMTDFTSKTLNKTFARIIFSPGLAENQGSAVASTATEKTQDDSFAAALQAEQKNNGAIPPTAQVTGGSAVAVAPLQEISIAKAKGDNSYNVEEIFSRRKELAGKKVRIQGKVVKFNLNIMGKNWVHLQDGSGDPLHNSHDLVVTTGATPNMDEIVTMEGILAADKDFGAGYKYNAIVEQAVLLKE